MLALSLTFPAGRYHAMPWDRHVNEGAVAWPPEPWRLLRALIATWHHKIKPLERHEESTLAALVESLSKELPSYCLPAASHSHTRHYMPQFKSGKTSLIFDAFAAVDPEDALFIIWPSVELSPEQSALLDDLLAVLGYLGRAESWVEAHRTDAVPQVNCVPGNQTLDTETGEMLGEVVTSYVSLNQAEYQTLRQDLLTDKKTARRLAKTLPDSLLQALSVETSDLRKHGWNQPPAARRVSYLRPVDALRPRRVTRPASAPDATTARFILIGKPLPRVENSVRIGELLRIALMSLAKRQFGEHAIPPKLSGHGLPPDNRHRHAFFLPWDTNGDGRIDRLLLHFPDGMSKKERRMVEKLKSIWSRDGGKWQLVLENMGSVEVGGALMRHGTEWQSITPYLHPWYAKKRFSVEDQIRRECQERGLPEPQIQQLPSITIKGRERRPVHFNRFRNKRGLSQPDRKGSFWRLTFAEPVTGPVALGFGCHFGLGLFSSYNQDRP